MREFRSASELDLHQVATWIASKGDALLWAGRRISYPIDLGTLAQDLEFELAISSVLIENSQLSAFGQIVAKPKGRRHLARLIVNPAKRRAGLGRVLAEYFVEVVRRAGVGRISLNVDPSNEAALVLYRRLGFEETARPNDEPESLSLYLECDENLRRS